MQVAGRIFATKAPGAAFRGQSEYQRRFQRVRGTTGPVAFDAESEVDAEADAPPADNVTQMVMVK